MLQLWHSLSSSPTEAETETEKQQQQTVLSRQAPPRGLKWRSSKRFISIVVSFSIFTDIFLYGMIVPVTPTALTERAGLQAEDLQRWTSILLALYGASLLAASPICGYIADRMASRKWPLIFGLFALAASTALLCAGTNMALWINGRIFQGMSAAVVWTVGIALLVDSYGVHEIGSAMGFVGMAFSLGNMSGPLLGGVIYQKCGYYAVFGLTFAFIGVDIALRLVVIEPKDVHKWLDEPVRKILTPEVSLACANLETLRVLSKESDNSAYTKHRSLSPSHRENTEPENTPCSLPSSRRHLASLFVLLRSSRMWLALFSYFVISILMTSFDSVLPIFVQDTFGWEQTGEGLVFVPLCLPHFLEPLWGRLGDRHRYVYRLFAAGAFFSLVPVLVLLRLVSSNTVGDQALLCTLLSLVGVCFSLALPPTMTEVTHVLNDIKTESPDAFGENGAVAQAYGLMNCAFAMGGLIGPVWAGFVREEYGWGAMSWSLALLSGVTAVPVLLGLGGWIGKIKQADRHGQGQEPDDEVQSSH